MAGMLKVRKRSAADAYRRISGSRTAGLRRGRLGVNFGSAADGVGGERAGAFATSAFSSLTTQ